MLSVDPTKPITPAVGGGAGPASPTESEPPKDSPIQRERLANRRTNSGRSEMGLLVDVSTKDKAIGNLQAFTGRLTGNRDRILAGEIRKSGAQLAVRGEHRQVLE